MTYLIFVSYYKLPKHDEPRNGISAGTSNSPNNWKSNPIMSGVHRMVRQTLKILQ